MIAPAARLPQFIGHNRALEALLSSEDIKGDQAEAYDQVNRAFPDAGLDASLLVPLVREEPECSTMTVPIARRRMLADDPWQMTGPSHRRH